MVAIESNGSTPPVARRVVERRVVRGEQTVVKIRVSKVARMRSRSTADGPLTYLVLDPYMVKGGVIAQYLHHLPGVALEENRGKLISAVVTVMYRRFEDGAEQYYLDFRPVNAVPGKRLAVVADASGDWARDAVAQGHEVVVPPEPIRAAIIFADPDCLIVRGPIRQKQKPIAPRKS